MHIVAATNRDLKAGSEAEAFRSDLYCRFSVFAIEIPPLWQRIDDFPLLAEHLLAAVAHRAGRAAAHDGAAQLLGIKPTTLGARKKNSTLAGIRNGVRRTQAHRGRKRVLPHIAELNLPSRVSLPDSLSTKPSASLLQRRGTTGVMRHPAESRIATGPIETWVGHGL